MGTIEGRDRDIAACIVQFQEVNSIERRKFCSDVVTNSVLKKRVRRTPFMRALNTQLGMYWKYTASSVRDKGRVFGSSATQSSVAPNSEFATMAFTVQRTFRITSTLKGSVAVRRFSCTTARVNWQNRLYGICDVWRWSRCGRNLPCTWHS